MTAHEYVPGREQLLNALEELQRELEAGVTWENNTLEHYLDSFTALLGSIENVYINAGEPIPTDPWVLLAQTFRGARNYE